MYSKEEASKLRQQFWITFGKYMKPIPSAEGLPINWVNYKTGVKNVYFRMTTEQKATSISIDITHADEQTRITFFEQFVALNKLFADAINEDWNWELDAINEYELPLSKISKTITGFSIFNQEHWPALISFLKPRIIALDQFWSDVKPVFEDLG
jgi:hypothetical protein